MSSRAATGDLTPAGSFLGSRYFPPSLVRTALAHDPKGLLFGTDAVPPLPLSDADKERVRQTLDGQRVRGKRLLLCSGGRDALVPFAVGKPVVDVLTDATRWYGGGGGVSVESRVYADVGHAFSKDMVEDTVRFLVDAVARGSRERESKAKM